MSIELYTPSFFDELKKMAAMVPVLHGTFGEWDELRPDVGSRISRVDPNRKGLYLAMANRKTIPHVSTFARKAVDARGGVPVIAKAKIDTAKGWLPHTLNIQGRKIFGNVEAAHSAVEDLHHIVGRDKASREARGPIWRKLQEGIGTWAHQDHAAPVKPSKYIPARASWAHEQQRLRQLAASG